MKERKKGIGYGRNMMEKGWCIIIGEKRGGDKDRCQHISQCVSLITLVPDDGGRSIDLQSCNLLRARLLELFCRLFVVTCMSCRSFLMISSPSTNSVRFDRMTALDTSASSCCTMAPHSAKSIPHATSTAQVPSIGAHILPKHFFVASHPLLVLT
jgi:hypothetical protein